MKTLREKIESARYGFAAAAKWFQQGMSTESILKQAQTYHTADYQRGVKAWVEQHAKG